MKMKTLTQVNSKADYGEFIPHDSRLLFGSLNHSQRNAINRGPRCPALTANSCVRGRATFRSLTTHSGQRPEPSLNWAVAIDPKRTPRQPVAMTQAPIQRRQ